MTAWVGWVLSYWRPDGGKVALIIGIVLVLLAILFAFLVSRARHARSGLVRWPVAIVATVLTVLLGFVGIVDLVGVYRLNAVYANPVANVKVAATADQISRGEHLAHLCA